MENRVPVVYVVSDSLGETAELVARAALSQFNGGKSIIRRVAHVQEFASLDDTIHRAIEEEALLVFTIVIPELKDYLVRQASDSGILAVDILAPLMEAIEQSTGQKPEGKPGLVHQLNAEYFRRVEAIEFAVKFDDGRQVQGLSQSAVILVGVSRTSKTPLSIYLAHKGLKVANVPLVPEVEPTSALYDPSNRQKVIGLSIRPEKLALVRQARLKALGLATGANYASYERILTELDHAESTMKRLGCPVIDVTDKAVEETAGLILEYITQREHVQ